MQGRGRGPGGERGRGRGPGEERGRVRWGVKEGEGGWGLGV